MRQFQLLFNSIPFPIPIIKLDDSWSGGWGSKPSWEPSLGPFFIPKKSIEHWEPSLGSLFTKEILSSWGSSW